MGSAAAMLCNMLGHMHGTDKTHCIRCQVCRTYFVLVEVYCACQFQATYKPPLLAAHSLL